MEGNKLRVTFHISVDVIERVRNTVVALCGPPDFLSMGGFAADALVQHCRQWERKRNRGGRFDARSVQPRTGRPPGR